jgi:hypothetical protein
MNSPCSCILPHSCKISCYFAFTHARCCKPNTTRTPVLDLPFQSATRTPELGSLVSSSEIGCARFHDSIFPGEAVGCWGLVLLPSTERHHLVICFASLQFALIESSLSTSFARRQSTLTTYCRFFLQIRPLCILSVSGRRRSELAMSASTAQQVVRRAQLYGRSICFFVTRAL